MKIATTYWQACLELARAQERELAKERAFDRRRHGRDAAARRHAHELDTVAEFHENGGAA